MQLENNDAIYNDFSMNPLSSERIISSMTNNNLSSDDDRITIYVYQPNARIRHIRLNKNSLISVLNAVYPKDSLYIYNGEILDNSKSFVYYNINKDNIIVLISSDMNKQNPNFSDKWLRLTNDKEKFEEMISLILDKNNRREIARLRDIRSMKNELKRRRFGSTSKVLNTQFCKTENQFKENNKEGEQLNVGYDSLNSPSIDPLPIIW